MKILIVDDEPLARELVREMLKNETEIGFINEAENGRQAVDLIKTEAPDIVFLDVQMPDLNGFEVLEALSIKELLRIPAIVFVTAYDNYALKAFEYHALDYLLKPFDRERFAATFNRAKEMVKSRSDGEQQQRILKMIEQIKDTAEYLEWLTIKKNERILLLRVDDIHWIEAQGNYVQLKFEKSAASSPRKDGHARRTARPEKIYSHSPFNNRQRQSHQRAASLDAGRIPRPDAKRQNVHFKPRLPKSVR